MLDRFDWPTPVTGWEGEVSSPWFWVQPCNLTTLDELAFSEFNVGGSYLPTGSSL